LALPSSAFKEETAEPRFFLKCEVRSCSRLTPQTARPRHQDAGRRGARGLQPGTPSLRKIAIIGHQQTVEDLQKDGSLDRKREVAIFEQPADCLGAAGLLPEPLKDHRRPDAPGANARKLTAAMLGEHQHRFNESGTGLQQRFQLAALAEQVTSPLLYMSGSCLISRLSGHSSFRRCTVKLFLMSSKEIARCPMPELCF